MRGLYLLVGLVLILETSLNAQTITSAKGGAWNDPTVWNGGVVPTSANSTLVSIGATHAITIPAGYDATAVDISMAGGTTNSITVGDITGSGSLTFTGILTLGTGPATRGRLIVNGILNVEQGATMAGGVASSGRVTIGATGRYRHNYTTTAGTIYSSTWTPGSTLEIAGYTTNTGVPAGLTQTFSNFEWNCTNQAVDIYLDGTLQNVNGNFSLLAPNNASFIFGLTTAASTTLSIGGSLTVAQDAFLDLTGGAGDATINLIGDFAMNSDDGVGNFGSGIASINFRGSSAQNFNSSNLISGFVDFTVFTNSRLNIADGNSIQTQGDFTLQSGATLGVGSADGLVIGQTAGNIQNFGSRTFTAGGNIVYNGSTAQNLGNEWSSGGALNNVAVNLEINNAAGVTNNIIGSTSLVGRLRLTNGPVNIGNSNTLIISGDFDGFSSPTRTGTISGDGSNTSSLEFSGSGTVTGTLNFTTGASTLQNFTLDRAGEIYLGTDVTIATTGTLTFSSSGNLRINGQTLTVNGNIVQSGSGAIATSVASSNLAIGGSGALSSLPMCTSCLFTNEFNTVTLSRTGGAAAYNWASPANINGILDLSSGAFTHSSGLNMATGSTFRRSAGTTYTGSTPNATTRYSISYVGNLTTGSELPTTALDRLLNLTIAGNVALDKDIIINGDLNVTGGTLNAGAHDITMLGATFAINGGSFTINSGNTVFFSRAGQTSLSGLTINDAQFGSVNIAGVTTLVAPTANIGVSGTWTNNGTFNANSGTVTFNGGAQDIDANNQSFFNLATANGVKTLTNNVDVNGSLTIQAASTLAADTYSINIAGTWLNQGTFTPGTGTVSFDGTAQSINGAGQAFYDIAFGNSGTKTLTAALDVDHSLTINSGVTLDVSASNFAMNVGLHFTNNGTLNPRSGTLFLDGSVIQTVTGTTNTVFNNITTSNASTISFATDQSLAGVLTLNQGTFNPNGHFIMLSTATRDARIAPLGATASISATDMTIQRYLPNSAGSQAYRYLTSPITTGTIAGWKDDFPVTGNFTDPSTGAEWPQFPGMNGVSLYRYNEAKTPSTTIDDRYEAYPLSGTSSSASATTNGRGYAAFVRQNAPITIEQVGHAAFGPIPVDITNQAAGANDGWNLIGNPYPAPINWDNVTLPAGVQGQIAVKDNTNTIGLGAGQYVYYTQGSPGVGIPSSYHGAIASGQAFWVRKTTAGPGTITFQEDDKQAINAPPFMKDGDIDMLRIHVASATHADELLIRFLDDAQDIAENKYDAYKLTNSYINFSSLSSDDNEMAINTLGPLTCAKEIPLHLSKVTAGGHVFTFTGADSFSEGVEIRLLDNFSGQTFLVTGTNNTYSFNVTTDGTSFGNDRFRLFIGYHTLDLGLNVQASNICSGNDASIRVVSPEAGVTYYAAIEGTTVSEEVVALMGEDISLSIPKSSLGSENNVVIMAKVGGCAGVPLSNIASVDVQPVPVVSNVEEAMNCGQGSVTLKASGAPSDGEYRWYPAEDATDPVAGENSSSFVTPVLTKTKTYFVAAVNSLGCEGERMAVTATINYAYDIVGVTGATSCEGGRFTLKATGAPADGTYKWYLSQTAEEAIPNQTSDSFVTPEISATTTYYVSVLNAAGCEGARAAVTAEIGSVTPAITQDGDLLTSNYETGNQWYLNGTAIEGATGKTYTATESGVYKLVVTSGNCSSQVEREFAVTGDIDGDGLKGYSVHPNATNGLIYVEVVTTEPVSVSVKSQLGAEVTRGNLKLEGNSRKGQLDITGQASGVYLVVINHGEKTVVRKIVKN